MYIGLNLGSTSAKKPLKDGATAVLTDSLRVRIIAEERITRAKAKGGFSRSLPALLREESIMINQVKEVVVSSCCDTIGNTEMNIARNKKWSKKMQVVGHHYSHALCAYSFSGYDNALVAVWDCGGDYYVDRQQIDTKKWWEYKRDQHSYYIIDRETITPLFDDFEFLEPFAMGFGEIYRALTYLLGFDSYIHSSKAMALAAYGDASDFAGTNLFQFDEGSGKIKSNIKYDQTRSFETLIEWVRSTFNIQLNKHSGPEQRDEMLLNFAAYVQRQMEQAAIKKINYLVNKYNIQNLCLSGGVALNCVMNEKIRENSAISQLYIPPGCGDIGQAMGNAIAGFYSAKKYLPDLSHLPIYFGRDTEVNDEILNEFNDYYITDISRSEKLKLAASLINEGRIIGWCQGLSEWGPRALGNRSILCKANDPDLAKLLRAEIKFRNFFEPFAASLHVDDFKRYFNSKAAELPYMVEVVHPKNEYADLFKNCVHIDNTCRIQTVAEKQNPLFFELLSEYKKLSGTSVMLNTSLNQRGAPICETARDAFYFFVSSKLEIIFIGDFLIVKNRELYNEINDLREKINLGNGHPIITDRS
jgi:carbamoyltransferase